MDVSEAGLVFCDPTAYSDESRFYEACSILRTEEPVHRVEAAGFTPFYAITKHEDVLNIERNNADWRAAPRPTLARRSQDGAARNTPIRTLVQMDPPDHTSFRQIGSSWFRPGRLKALESTVRELARRHIDHMAELGSECDFVTDVAMHFPLQVIMSILGIPPDDYGLMLKLTQEMFGTDDPEFRRDSSVIAVLRDFFNYFQALTEKRRADPTDDLASAIANAEVDGARIGDLEAAGYYVIIATAGHDTTSATIAGGLHALLQHPEQLALLRADPSLMASAAEEMIRWVSPVKQFMRTAAVDYVIRGTTIRAGESVLLSFPSANRDEDVFDRPELFDVRRDPNRHLGFGFGAHFCLGAQLARLETRVFFSELLPRLNAVELAGTPSFIETLFVGGLKRLPIRFELA